MTEPSIIGALMSLRDAGLLPGALIYAEPGSALACVAADNCASPTETRHTRFYGVQIIEGFFLTIAVAK